MEGKFICSSEISTNNILFHLPDIWFVLLVDVVLKIESKLLCPQTDFKTFYHFSLYPCCFKGGYWGAVCVRGSEEDKRREERKIWRNGEEGQIARSSTVWNYSGWITYYIPSTELKLVCLEKEKLRRLILEIEIKDHTDFKVFAL